MDKTIIKQEQLFSKKLLKNAFFISIKKLNPLSLLRNPVMLSVEVCCIVTTIYFIISLFYNIGESSFFTGQVSLWLWLTVFFATFAESLSEGRGQARAESMRKSGTEVMSK
jgi:K+-transporting ATPase ATPase B chain